MMMRWNNSLFGGCYWIEWRRWIQSVLLILVVCCARFVRGLQMNGVRRHTCCVPVISRPFHRSSRLFGGEVAELRMKIENLGGSADLSCSVSTTELYTLRFGGVGRLYAGSSSGQQWSSETTIMKRLETSIVMVIGLGGVGSWAAEALCRSGIGTIVLVDCDDICISNSNRQIQAMSTTIGKMKLDVLKERMININPDCTVELIHDFVNLNNVHEIFDHMHDRLGQNPTAVLDAIDGSKEKAAIIAECQNRRIHIVTSGGAAGRRDPTQIQVSDLTAVESDKMLAACRKELRKQYEFEAGLSFRERQKRKVRPWKIPSVYSVELVASLRDEQKSSQLRLCDGAMGTACFVTGTFGFLAASSIVDAIATDSIESPRGRK
jgi:tRNA A37 threonylcarbamoyladenosine dehydratase